MECHSTGLSSCHCRMSRESQLGAVVADDHERPAAKGDGAHRARGRPPVRERGVDDECQAFAGEVVDHDQHTESADRRPTGRRRSPGSSAGSGPVAWPSAPVSRARACARHAGAPSAALHGLCRNSFLWFSTNCRPPQQDVQPPIAEPPPLTRQGLQALPDRHVVGATRGHSDRSSDQARSGCRPDAASKLFSSMAQVNERSPRSGLIRSNGTVRPVSPPHSIEASCEEEDHHDPAQQAP